MGFLSHAGDSGSQDNIDVRTCLSDAARQRKTIHVSRELHVRQNDVDPAPTFQHRPNVQRGHPFDHPISATAQVFRDDHADHDIGLHHHDGLYIAVFHAATLKAPVE